MACLLGGLGVLLVERATRAGRYWREAEEASAGLDFTRAQAALTTFLEMRPESAEAHFLLARACRRARREDFDRARAHLAEAKRLKWSDQAVAAESVMLAFQEHGRPDARERALFAFLEGSAAERRLALEALARGCLRGDRLEEAGLWFDRWVAAYPDDWYAYLWRGTLFQHSDKPDRAVADFERVLRLHPHGEDVGLRLGLALVQSGADYARALRLLEEHRQRHPDDVDALIGIARSRGVLGEPEAARALLESVLTAHPGHFDALLAKALVALDREDDPEALRLLRQLEPLARSLRTGEAFQRLLRLEPAANSNSIPTRLRTLYHLLATVLRRLGQGQEALAYERRLLRLEADVAELLAASREVSAGPDDPALWYKLGALNLRVGMKENGEYWLGRVLAANPDDRRAHQALAEFYRGHDDPESRQKAERHQRLAGDGEEVLP